MPDFNIKDFIKDLEDTSEEELAKKYGYFFCYSLDDAFGNPEYWLLIFDRDVDNAIAFKNENEYQIVTLSDSSINEIKDYIIQNGILFRDDLSIVTAPVLDGTTDKIFISTNKEKTSINTSNLWYWIKENVMNVKSDFFTEEEKEYTKAIIVLLTVVKSTLKKYNLRVDFYIDE